MLHAFTQQYVQMLPSQYMNFRVSPSEFDRSVCALLADKPNEMRRAWSQLKQKFVIVVSAVSSLNRVSFDTVEWLNQPQVCVRFCRYGIYSETN